MKGRIAVFCLLLLLALFSMGCGIGIGKSGYKYKIFVDTGGIRNHILYSDSFDIDTHGFLTVNNPTVRGESHVGRVICSPGTYLILER